MVDRSNVVGSAMDGSEGEPAAKTARMGDSPPHPKPLTAQGGGGHDRSRSRDKQASDEKLDSLREHTQELYGNVIHVRKRVTEFSVTQNKMQHTPEAASDGFKRIPTFPGLKLGCTCKESERILRLNQRYSNLSHWETSED